MTAVRTRWAQERARTGSELLDQLASQVVEGTSDPYTAADRLLETR